MLFQKTDMVKVDLCHLVKSFSLPIVSAYLISVLATSLKNEFNKLYTYLPLTQITH
jgi:hypothetical protein